VKGKRSNARLAGIAALLLLWWPGVASACAVCFSGRSDETRTAFLVSTVFLTFLPLILLGGVVWWLRRRHQELEAAPQEL